MTSAIYLPIQVIILVLSTVFLVYSIYMMIIRKTRWYDYMSLLVFMIHTITFYSVTVYANLNNIPVSVLFGVDKLAEIWSSILRIHSIVTVGLLAMSNDIRINTNG